MGGGEERQKMRGFVIEQTSEEFHLLNSRSISEGLIGMWAASLESHCLQVFHMK